MAFSFWFVSIVDPGLSAFDHRSPNLERRKAIDGVYAGENRHGNRTGLFVNTHKQHRCPGICEIFYGSPNIEGK